MAKKRAQNKQKEPNLGRQSSGLYRCENGSMAKSLRNMFYSDRMSGKNHSLKDGTVKAFRSRLGQMMDYMHQHRGIADWHSIGKNPEHLLAYIEFLKNRPSRKGENAGKDLDDGRKQGLFNKTLANHLSSIRHFCERENIPFPERNAPLGVTRDRKNDEEKPIIFRDGWAERRAAIQEKMDQASPALGAASQLRAAFGLRQKESSISNIELRVRAEDSVGGRELVYLLSVAGRPFVRVEHDQLCSQRYFKAHFEKRLERAEAGKDYLLVKGAKNGRTRIQEIYNAERRAALDCVQELCRQNEDLRITDGTPPVIFPYRDCDITSKGTVSKGFMTRVRKEIKQAMERLGGTIPNQLHCNADRHMDTQRLYYTLTNGTDIRSNPEMMAYWESSHDKSIFRFSRDNIIEERGHSDGRKVCHYHTDPLGRY